MTIAPARPRLWVIGTLMAGSVVTVGCPTSAVGAVPAPTRITNAAGPVATAQPTPKAAPSANLAAQAQRTLQLRVAAYLAHRDGEVGVAVLDLRTGATLDYRGHAPFVTASIVKADILSALLLKRAASAAGHRGLTRRERSLAVRMITRSDNAAASALWRAIGGGAGLAAANRRLGLRETVPGRGAYWGLTRTTARDQIRLLQAITTTTSPLTASARAYLLGLMQSVVRDQRWGVSAAAVKHPKRADVAVKNGWLPRAVDDGDWVINSIGRVRTSSGAVVLIAVLSRGSDSMPSGITTVQRVAQLAAESARLLR